MEIVAVVHFRGQMDRGGEWEYQWKLCGRRSDEF